MFINGWNGRCRPFVWTKTADEILTEANRPTNPNCRSTSGYRSRFAQTRRVGTRVRS
jgi:hypothetical protein